jgi:putative oxidoreductase
MQFIFFQKESCGGMSVLIIVLEVLVGLAFAMAGMMKLMGQQMHIDNFKRWRLPAWMRPLTGAVELIGGAAMLAGIWVEGLAAWAGIWLGITMLVAVGVHLRVKETAKQWSAPLILLILAVAVTAMQGF